MNHYDPKTCITAGELRKAGVDIPPCISDNAWTTRDSIRVLAGNISEEDRKSRKLPELYIELEFTEPLPMSIVN